MDGTYGEGGLRRHFGKELVWNGVWTGKGRQRWSLLGEVWRSVLRAGRRAGVGGGSQGSCLSLVSLLWELIPFHRMGTQMLCLNYMALLFLSHSWLVQGDFPISVEGIGFVSEEFGCLNWEALYQECRLLSEASDQEHLLNLPWV